MNRPMTRFIFSLITGIVIVILFHSMIPIPGPHSDEDTSTLFFLGLSVSNSLMVLPPIFAIEKSLRRIPAFGAIALNVIIVVVIFNLILDGIPGGAILGGQQGYLLWTIPEILVSSISCIIVLGFDNILTKFIHEGPH